MLGHALFDQLFEHRKLSVWNRIRFACFDELIFEAPEAEVEATLPIVKQVMEQAPLPAMQLSVPLQVDARAADNWDDAH